MKPDRAHRTFNTVLLITIIAIQSIYNTPPNDPPLADALMALGIYGALLSLIFLSLWMAPQYKDEILDYAGLSN